MVCPVPTANSFSFCSKRTFNPAPKSETDFPKTGLFFCWRC